MTFWPSRKSTRAKTTPELSAIGTWLLTSWPRSVSSNRVRVSPTDSLAASASRSHRSARTAERDDSASRAAKRDEPAEVGRPRRQGPVGRDQRRFATVPEDHLGEGDLDRHRPASVHLHDVERGIGRVDPHATGSTHSANRTGEVDDVDRHPVQREAVNGESTLVGRRLGRGRAGSQHRSGTQVEPSLGCCVRPRVGDDVRAATHPDERPGAH